MAITLLLISCSPQKRLNRLVKKHPELLTVDSLTIKDTILYHDTFFVPGQIITDSITINDLVAMAESLVYENDNMKLLITRLNDSESFELSAIYKGDTIVRTDTIYYTKQIPVNHVLIQPPKIDVFLKAILFFIALLLVFRILFPKR